MKIDGCISRTFPRIVDPKTLIGTSVLGKNREWIGSISSVDEENDTFYADILDSAFAEVVPDDRGVRRLSLTYDALSEKEPVYTHTSEELNSKIAELMDDYERLVVKAKSFGLDIRLYANSETLELYYNDDYPDTLLVDKDLSARMKGGVYHDQT